MNANYIYNVQYSEEAAAIAYAERNNSAEAKGMSEKNQTYLSNINAAIAGAVIQQGKQKDEGLDFTRVRMKTSYPGVLIGTGSAHETGAKNEMLLGFTLDYVTGIPYLPGSSLKGLLRSAFKFGDSKESETEYIQETLAAITGKDVRKKNIEDLETALFADPDNEIVFLDSFIQGMTADAGENAAYMGIDYITPHKGDPLKNPIPLPLLRINPNVVFDFRFHLQDVKIKDGPVYPAETIQKLFTEILKDFGIGAKTHVGYGMLEDYRGEISTPACHPADTRPAQPAPNTHPANQAPVHHREVPHTPARQGTVHTGLQDLSEGSIVTGTISSITDFGLFIDLGNHKRGMVHISQAANHYVNNLHDEFEVGQTVQARVIKPKKPDQIALSIKQL